MDIVLQEETIDWHDGGTSQALTISKARVKTPWLHCNLDCLHFGAIGGHYTSFLQDAAGSIRSVRLFMWHKDQQQAVSHCSASQPVCN